ncbi:GntR family transcriptional regulator [Paracoccus sp. SCSIO 75233]|uniref:GntR family transcriptional regulator n=1 Tax=Paracoccus sp. SCSIO 75233 TaxID=3017782 RepID=UPI0022F11602|nr:GntR family transcriptional regulator [Paracoccus sp. SCSIO 75233]WBU54529.1 GntR family transcriptional regulator [Paracoccus sp. SCSIO 75233]
MESHAALPVYMQISELLAREIAAGHLLDGEKLPPEREMAGRLGISVGTLRRALAELTERGLLERRQGSGNYIRVKGDARNIYSFFRIELLAGGGLPTATLLSLDRMEKPASLPRFGEGDQGWRIRRLRSLNDQPCVLEEIWLCASYAEQIGAGDLSESLYLFYRERLNLWISHVDDSVGIATVPGWSPPAFSPKPGATVGYFARSGFDQNNRPAEVSRNWFDTSLSHYVSRIR